MRIGDKIRVLRKQNGMTQKELAEIVGISASALGMYEQSRRNPNFDTLLKMSNHFQVNVTYFFEDSTEETENEVVVKAFVELLKNMSLNELEILDALVEEVANRKRAEKEQEKNNAQR